ncbi:monooxygenase family protein [Tundrisphaera lichenicola]|uniref:monooxygenase family protein n=1 Tax=Tundrisphaera lichenicola TaxID=2029860 RepID=UPI003EB83290
MNRVVASLPDSVEELCLVRLGLMARRLRAFPFAARMGRAIDRSASESISNGRGLLRSERFGLGWGHFGVLQYWSSFETLEAWSHRGPHSDWWREALERMRTKEDFGIYHETYLVPRSGIESIYLNCPPAGLSAFGPTGPAVGASTTSRDRLGRRDGRG